MLKQEIELLGPIKQIFHASGQEYGSRRVQIELNKSGHQISKTRVSKIMSENDLVAKAIKRVKVTTKQSMKPYYVADNLLHQNFTIEAPNQAWCGDITYVPTDEGWLYVATVTL